MKNDFLLFKRNFIIFATLKRRNTKKMNTYKYVFINGFFYTLGLSSNPIGEIIDAKKHITDLDNIKSDWNKIGNDIKKAYEIQTASAK